MAVEQPRPRTTRPVLRTVAYGTSLVRALAKSDADVVVQRAAGTATGLVALLSRARRRRFVYSSANVIDFEYERLEPRRRNVRLFHLGVRLAHRIVVQTEEQAALCRANFGRTPVVIPSLAEPVDRPRGEPEAFLWVGRLTHYKRPHAFLELARAVPEARFRMIGVPFGTEGERLATELSAEAEAIPNLELLEPRPRHALMTLVEAAVAMVNTADYEGMPNIFLEGWSRGVPALTLAHDPDGVVARHGLGDFADRDMDRLADAARKLWRCRHDQSALSERCIAYIASQHAPAVVAQRWASALNLTPRRS